MPTSKPPTTAQALRFARSHPSLKQVLDDGGRVVLVEPDRGRGKSDRLVIAVHDHTGEQAFVALVDSKGIVGVRETPARFQLADDERELAERLAAADARVKSFLRRRRMNPLTRLYFPPDARGHRHAIVFARPTSSERRYAVVDLVEERVVDVLGESDLTRRGEP